MGKKELPELKIGGRSIPLYYSTYETIAIQREIGCTAYELKDVVFGVQVIDEEKDATLENIRLQVANDAERMEKLGKLIAILGNAGLEETGQEAEITAKWVLRNMDPKLIVLYATAMMAVIVQGNVMEAKDEKGGEPVDEILEEENAKKRPGS